MSLPRRGLPVAFLGVAVQLGGVLIVLAVLAPFVEWLGHPLAGMAELITMGVVSAVLGYLAGMPRWWLPINLLFVPLLALVYFMTLPPWAFLLLFALLLAVYWPVLRNRVPLYLTGQRAGEALLALMPSRNGLRFIDLGAGTGRLLAWLASARSDNDYAGIESAPLPWLAGWLTIRSVPGRLSWRWGDFWAEPLAGYDVIYAYLSPAPMPRLLEKLRAEMRPDACFISNTFPLPGITPVEAREIGDVHGSTLYVYGHDAIMNAGKGAEQ